MKGEIILAQQLLVMSEIEIGVKKTDAYNERLLNVKPDTEAGERAECGRKISFPIVSRELYREFVVSMNCIGWSRYEQSLQREYSSYIFWCYISSSAALVL